MDMMLDTLRWVPYLSSQDVQCTCIKSLHIQENRMLLVGQQKYTETLTGSWEVHLVHVHIDADVFRRK